MIFANKSEIVKLSIRLFSFDWSAFLKFFVKSIVYVKKKLYLCMLFCASITSYTSLAS